MSRGAIYKPVHSIALVPDLHFWHTTCYHFIAFQQVSFDTFFQPYDAVETLLKGIIMADNDELIEATHTTESAPRDSCAAVRPCSVLAHRRMQY